MVTMKQVTPVKQGLNQSKTFNTSFHQFDSLPYMDICGRRVINDPDMTASCNI
ncbi:MAG: hypothetical protein ACI8RD_008159 [Bacillariaceae sp.]|jgi:hypothetical protein